MNNKSIILTSLLLALSHVLVQDSYAQDGQAQDINVEDLGSLKTEFKPIVKTDYMQTKKVLASVSSKAGESYVLTTPTNVQQLHYLVNNGEIVKKGQAFAVLSGPEVHHFLSELVAAKALFKLSEQRMKNSQKLFEKKLIEEEKWLKISQNYYESSLKYEHMLHFDVLIESIDEANDSVTIRSPIGGILSQSSFDMRLTEGDVIARFIPESAVRLQMQVAPNQVEDLEYVELKNCRLNISSVSRIVSNGFANIWTESVKNDCGVYLGEKLSVTPFYKRQTYRVAKTAVFNLEGKDKIFIRSDNKLAAVDISLITLIDQDYIFSSDTDLADASVLVSSVSAAQGILLGLGGE